MFRFNRTTLFLLVWLFVKTTSTSIHQKLIISKQPQSMSAEDKETTTAGPGCETLSSKGYALINDDKWMKYNADFVEYADCVAFCDADDARVATVRSASDEVTMRELQLPTGLNWNWIGLRQVGLTSYEWQDGTPMEVVDHGTGATDLDGGFEAWMTPDDFDIGEVAPDEQQCFYYSFQADDNKGWTEIYCVSRYPCACECKY